MVVRQGILSAVGQGRIEEADALESLGPRHAEVGDLALLHAGTAESLHAEQDAFQAARLMRERTADK